MGSYPTTYAFLPIASVLLCLQHGKILPELNEWQLLAVFSCLLDEVSQFMGLLFLCIGLLGCQRARAACREMALRCSALNRSARTCPPR